MVTCEDCGKEIPREDRMEANKNDVDDPAVCSDCAEVFAAGPYAKIGSLLPYNPFTFGAVLAHKRKVK